MTRVTFVELMNALLMTEGIGTRSSASHTRSFGSADDACAFRSMGLFEQSGLSFIANPTENAYLPGGRDTYRRRLTGVISSSPSERSLALPC